MLQRYIFFLFQQKKKKNFNQQIFFLFILIFSIITLHIEHKKLMSYYDINNVYTPKIDYF